MPPLETVCFLVPLVSMSMGLRSRSNPSKFVFTFYCFFCRAQNVRLGFLNLPSASSVKCVSSRAQNMRLGIDAVGAAGGIVEAAVCYTGDITDPSS